jgi:AraC-like DNA-binding protein
MNESPTYLNPKIAAHAIRSLVNFAERHGLEREVLLLEAGLTEAQLNDGGLLIDVSCHESIYALAARLLDDPLLGFIQGQEYEPECWGVLGLIALTSSSIGASIAAQYRFQSLTGNMGAPLQVSHGLFTSIQWVPAYNCSHHMSENIITGLLSSARVLTNRPDYAPNAVYFTHAPKANIDVYAQYFKCPVHFNAEHNALMMDNAILQWPLRKSDVELNKVLTEHAVSLLTEQSFTSPMEVIKDYVIKNLPDHVPDLDEVARYLNLSVRSAQRKLSEYGTSYSQILDAIRKELALTYLRQTSNSVLYVSERLGFSEQSAFQRAFKRWTNTTPRRYRLEVLGKGGLV